MIPIKIPVATVKTFDIKIDFDNLTIIPMLIALNDAFQTYDPIQLKEATRRVVMIVKDNKKEYDISVDQAAAIYPKIGIKIKFKTTLITLTKEKLIRG